jgi:hypothetical protein
MRRKVFDKLASVGGVVVVIVLAVAGALLMFGYSFANNYVHTQLAEQQITFPSAAAFAHPDGQRDHPVHDSHGVPIRRSAAAHRCSKREVYANDFINVHLGEIGGGKTYSQLSAEAMALPKGSAAYTAAEAKVQTVFQGTTLRGLLLEAYGFSLIAEIASLVRHRSVSRSPGSWRCWSDSASPTPDALARTRSSCPATLRRGRSLRHSQAKVPSEEATPGPRKWAGCCASAPHLKPEIRSIMCETASCSQSSTVWPDPLGDFWVIIAVSARPCFWPRCEGRPWPAGWSRPSRQDPESGRSRR